MRPFRLCNLIPAALVGLVGMTSPATAQVAPSYLLTDLGAAAGAGTLVRHGGAGDASGDPLAPIAAALAGAELRLSGSFLLFADARYAVQWIRIDGARRASADPAAELGVAFGF